MRLEALKLPTEEPQAVVSVSQLVFSRSGNTLLAV